jgi:hypothetical protein
MVSAGEGAASEHSYDAWFTGLFPDPAVADEK